MAHVRAATGGQCRRGGGAVRRSLSRSGNAVAIPCADGAGGTDDRGAVLDHPASQSGYGLKRSALPGPHPRSITATQPRGCRTKSETILVSSTEIASARDQLVQSEGLG